MFNKRKLDEVIENATTAYDPEEHCGYTFEEYLAEPLYQEHVCIYVRDCLMPDVLTDYLYKDCYYDDLETVKANLYYVNFVMHKMELNKKWWIDISLETILKNIQERKDKEAKREEAKHPDVTDDFSGLINK